MTACAEGNVSYCTDCATVKTRAVEHGFQVAQLQDAFEVNSVQQLLGSLYNEVVLDTRFDVNRHVYRISANGAPSLPICETCVLIRSVKQVCKQPACGC